DVNKVLRIRKGKTVDQDRVDDREYRAVDADSKRQSNNCNQREAWALAQHAQTVSEVLEESHRPEHTFAGLRKFRGKLRSKLMRKTIVVLILMTCVCPWLAAHHGASAYDRTSRVTLKATITEFKWTNPHV